jgi:hypothetical protein
VLGTYYPAALRTVLFLKKKQIEPETCEPLVGGADIGWRAWLSGAEAIQCAAVLRWSVGWLMLIAVATAGAYFGTHNLAAASDTAPAMRRLAVDGGPGTPGCTRATRALVDAGDGAVPGASGERRQAYETAARAVLDACSQA